jgi:DNA modification methylase
MPSKLVEFFVRFLTDADDLMIDPFAGSNTTGAVAESLGRRWRSIEIQAEYVELSKARFGIRQAQVPLTVDIRRDAKKQAHSKK